MPTTFTSRELVRDELVSKFVANGSWQEVYGYHPSVNELENKTPFLVIRSAGTRTEMAGEFTNPTTYRFAVISYVLAYSASDSWDSADAEDKLDELDRAVRQIIRDNAGGMTTCNLLSLEGGMSQAQDVIIEGIPYIRESRFVTAHLVKGS
jgi:hypothetical protein